MSDARWITVRAAARIAVYSINYFRDKLCFPNDGLPRPFRIREFPTRSGGRRIQVDQASLEAWLRSLES